MTLLWTALSFASVSVSAPGPGSSVGSPVQFVSTATSDFGRPVTSMILYVDNVQKYVTYSNKIDTTVSGLSIGWHNVIVKSWDSGGALSQAGPYGVYVNGSNTGTPPAGGNANITVSTPAAGSTVTSPTRFVASAKSSTTYPISSMILYVDNVERYRTLTATLDTTQSLAGGTRNILIKSWDNSGKLYQYTFTVNVGSGDSAPVGSGITFSSVEQMAGWASCDACAGAGGTGPAAPHSLIQGVASPSIDGKSAQFWMGGTTAYSNVLWWKQLVSETQASTNRSLRHFVYDAYFYATNPRAAQSLEWDVNQFVDGKSLIFGTQCSYRSAGTWDIWDNINSRWVSTGIACPPLLGYTWNHVVVEFERTSTNQLHYISVSMNGIKHYLDRYYAPKSTTWSGITVNYQMDGNYQQEDYSTWLDNLTLKAW